MNTTLPRRQVPTFISFTVGRSHTLVVCLRVVCAGEKFAQPIYCNDIDLLAPDSRSTMPSQLDEICDPLLRLKEILRQVMTIIGLLHLRKTRL